MTRMVLATSDLAGTLLRRAERADVVIGIKSHFFWGPLPSQAELETSLQARIAP